MENPTGIFLATMFSGKGHASSETGMLVATSTDGVTFNNIHCDTDPVYTPDSGVRDPIVLYWHGHWYMVHSYGGNVSAVVFLAKSPDLVNWTAFGSLRLADDNTNNYVDVPQWIVDQVGNVHVIACTDNNHNWVEIHPLSVDPATWSDQSNWSEVTTLTDYSGEALVQGNSFVTLRNDLYYMGFDDETEGVYHLRTSTDLTSQWSEARSLNIDSDIHRGDSENLMFLPDGRLRFYISNGNPLKYLIWYVDSFDLGFNWTAPNPLRFWGFSPPGINWAQIVRITDPDAISAMLAANQVKTT
jgi:sucrose-6-phosphate hydrolase SacC (GH32 family)